MSTFNYARTKATVLRLLTRYGQQCTVVTTATTGGTTSSRSGKMAEINTVKHTLGDTGVQIGDIHAILEASLVPLPGDSLTRTTGVTVERLILADPVIPIKPGPTIIGYECYLRAG